MNLVSTTKYRQSWTAENVSVAEGFASGSLFFTGVSYETGQPVEGHHLEKQFRAKLDGRKFKVGVGSSGAKIGFEVAA